MFTKWLFSFASYNITRNCPVHHSTELTDATIRLYKPVSDRLEMLPLINKSTTTHAPEGLTKVLLHQLWNNYYTHIHNIN